jgi:hypothetical protein
MGSAFGVSGGGDGGVVFVVDAVLEVVEAGWA